MALGSVDSERTVKGSWNYVNKRQRLLYCQTGLECWCHWGASIGIRLRIIINKKKIIPIDLKINNSFTHAIVTYNQSRCKCQQVLYITYIHTDWCHMLLCLNCTLHTTPLLNICSVVCTTSCHNYSSLTLRMRVLTEDNVYNCMCVWRKSYTEHSLLNHLLQYPTVQHLPPCDRKQTVQWVLFMWNCTDKCVDSTILRFMYSNLVIYTSTFHLSFTISL